MSSCLFCRIASGDIPAAVVHETERTVAFRDLGPQAPVHVLVIPREHHDNIAAASRADGSLVAEIFAAAAAVADAEGIAETGFRLVTNTGAEGGQSVGHLHIHVLGGRQMAWPPG